MPRKDAYGGTISAQAQQDLVSEGIENFELPKSLVMKIAKSAIPDNVKLQKETVVSLVKGSTVFINYLSATAHDVAQSRQHKSISASDVIKALEIMQFRTVSLQCQHELNDYRELAKQAEARPKKTGTGNASTSASKKTVAPNAAGNTSSASASAKGKGKERAVPAIPLPPPFTSTPLPLGVGAADDVQSSGPPVSISATELGERGDEPMDVDTWTGPIDNGPPQDFESGHVIPDDKSDVVESMPIESVHVESVPVESAPAESASVA